MHYYNQQNGYSIHRVVSDRMKKNAANLTWQVRKASQSNVRTVSVTAKDCPGIFSKIVGVFTLNGFDILSAKTYRQDKNMFAMFNVRSFPDHPSEEEGLIRAKKDLRSVLFGKLNLSVEFYRKTSAHGSFSKSYLQTPPRVVVDNKSSFLFSIVEISAYDFPGLLFKVTDALFRCDVRVWKANVSTKGDRVFDVFYIKDFDEEKIVSPTRVSGIKASIKAALQKRN